MLADAAEGQTRQGLPYFSENSENGEQRGLTLLSDKKLTINNDKKTWLKNIQNRLESLFFVDFVRYNRSIEIRNAYKGGSCNETGREESHRKTSLQRSVQM